MTQLVRYSKTAASSAALAFSFAATPALASAVMYSGTECNGGDNTFFDGQYSNNTGNVADVVHCPIPIEFDLLNPTVGVLAPVRDQNAVSNFSCSLRAVTTLPGGAITIQTTSDGTTGSSANYVAAVQRAARRRHVVAHGALPGDAQLKPHRGGPRSLRHSRPSSTEAPFPSP